MVRSVLLALSCNFIYSSDLKSSVSNRSQNANVDDVVKSNNKNTDAKIGTEVNKKSAVSQVKKKTKFSTKPYFIGFGFDPFTLLYNFFTNFNNIDDAKTNNLLDFRLKVDTGFNRILFATNFGILRWNIETKFFGINYIKKTTAFFINPCVYYNFLKKNSFRNAFYIGGGVNFNMTSYSETDTDNTENSPDNTFKDKKLWLWFNLELGNRIRLIRFFYINANFRITFLNFNLKSYNDKVKRSISEHHDLYGYGYAKKSYNIEFCINFLFNIDLFEDEKVNLRESYFYM